MLEPAPEGLFSIATSVDDPRLGATTQRWGDGDPVLTAGQPVIVGFPCDVGVRRNNGRPGAALGPNAIRRWLYRMVAFAADHGTETWLTDLGNVRVTDDLEANQERLGRVLAEVFRAEAVPIVLGGGHETTYGHYLGYVFAGIDCGIVNIDAHLDVREYPTGGHSGSPFRQAFDHPTQRLRHGCYVVVGAQRHAVAQAHADFVFDRGGRIIWREPGEATDRTVEAFTQQITKLEAEQACSAVLVTVDADAFCQAEVPGCSAPSPLGLPGFVWPTLASYAGSCRIVRSIDLVEVNPRYDCDDQTARWAATGIWYFLAGLRQRR